MRLVMLAGLAAITACSGQRDAAVPLDSAHTVAAVPAQDTTPWTPTEIVTDTGPMAPSSDPPTFVDSALDDTPEIAWLLPGQILLSNSRRATLHVLSADSIIHAARFRRSLSREDHLAIMRTEQVACEISEGTALFEYQMPVQIRGERRVLVTSRAVRPTAAGLRGRSVSASQVTEADLLLGSTEERNDTAFAIRQGGPYISLHARFNPASRVIIGSALVFWNSGNEMVASQVRTGEQYANWCDGCEAPTAEFGLTGLYALRMAFEVPGFLWPLLLIDTSTYEGQALSLVTVNAAGAIVELRRYEYVVNC